MWRDAGLIFGRFSFSLVFSFLLRSAAERPRPPETAHKKKRFSVCNQITRRRRPRSLQRRGRQRRLAPQRRALAAAAAAGPCRKLPPRPTGSTC